MLLVIKNQLLLLVLVLIYVRDFFNGHLFTFFIHIYLSNLFSQTGQLKRQNRVMENSFKFISIIQCLYEFLLIYFLT